MEKLKLSARKIGPHEEILIIKLQGMLESTTAPFFTTKVEEEINKGNVKILIDADKLEFVGSSGIGAFIELLDKVGDKNGCIHFMNLPETIEKTFKDLTIDELFSNFKAEEDAITKMLG